jgi:hypothetical protein
MAMQLAMMRSAERHRELVADLTPQDASFRELDVVGI